MTDEIRALAKRNASDIQKLDTRVSKIEEIVARRSGGIAAILATVTITMSIMGLLIAFLKLL